jgi:uncharacterized membrane protein YgdD (TMEM256/DUF423 family)
MADPAKQMKANQYVTIFMGAVLLFGAFGAVMITADEYDPATLVWMHIGLDAIMTSVIAVLLVQIGKGAETSGLKILAMVLGVAGLIAGLVKLAASGPRRNEMK